MYNVPMYVSTYVIMYVSMYVKYTYLSTYLLYLRKYVLPVCVNAWVCSAI